LPLGTRLNQWRELRPEVEGEDHGAN
jgi:hypothetical protein